MWPAIIAAGAAIGGSLLAQSSAKDTREYNALAAADAFNESERAYGQRYQATVKDMRAAGLNPIMAASGGFSVGNAPQMSVPQPVPYPSADYATAFSSSAKNIYDAYKSSQETEESKSRESLNYQKVQESFQNVVESRAKTGVLTEQEKVAVAQVDEIGLRISKMAQEIESIRLSRDLTRENISTAVQERELIRQRQGEVSQHAKALKAETDRLKAILPQLLQTSEAYKGPVGGLLGYINALTSALNLNVGTFLPVMGRGKPNGNKVKGAFTNE